MQKLKSVYAERVMSKEKLRDLWDREFYEDAQAFKYFMLITNANVLSSFGIGIGRKRKKNNENQFLRFTVQSFRKDFSTRVNFIVFFFFLCDCQLMAIANKIIIILCHYPTAALPSFSIMIINYSRPANAKKLKT